MGGGGGHGGAGWTPSQQSLPPLTGFLFENICLVHESACFADNRHVTSTCFKACSSRAPDGSMRRGFAAVALLRVEDGF